MVTLPDDLAARLEGKSSLGRLGLLTHSTAGFVDPGFSGHITLELSNVANLPITLWPGMKIGQLCMFRLTSPGGAPVRLGGLRLPLPGPARPDAVPVLPQLHPRGDPASVLTCALTGGSAPATSRTSLQWPVDDQPGTNRFTSSSAYRSRVMNQPVTVRTTHAGEHQHEHRT